MGLDMYLTAERYFWGDDGLKIQEKLQKTMKGCPFKVKTIGVEVGYWRKANAIHKWFVDNVQEGIDDCGDYSVSNDQLKELLSKVNEAIVAGMPKDVAAIADSKKQSEILPAESGFFFGSTTYDESYLNDMTNTQEIIESWLNYKDNKHYELQYHSSW